MLVYLDSKDLIELLERSRPCSADEFGKSLTDGDHRLLLSPPLIYEISAPLLKPNVSTNVMKLLNRLEALPHTYFGQAKSTQLELLEAVEAHAAGQEFVRTDPFVHRFDYTIQEQPATADFLNLSLAEAVWILWRDSPEIWTVPARNLLRYQNVLTNDRNTSGHPSLKNHFPTALERNLKLYRIPVPNNLHALADWIFVNPLRCPSYRLGFEVYHKLQLNRTDAAKESDLDDFAHVDCVPYVDLITLDRRMATYVAQASRAMGTDYHTKVCKNVEEVLARL